MTAGFEGFHDETATFFSELARHNDKRWFEKHRDDYREHVVEPSLAFIVAMSAKLRRIAPGVMPDTRTNGAGSLFRIHRDTRFSKDKSPYKTHLGIFLWDGRARKMDSRGLYFHIEPPNMMLAAGMYRFTPAQLKLYRESVADARSGPALARAVTRVTRAPGISIGEPHYKRVPRGFDPSHPRADLLKHDGMYAYTEGPIPSEFTSPKLLEHCLERWKPMMPLYRWLERLSG